MSKNLEEEYKKLALDEAPDLWDRIEAGLSEKSTSEEDKKRKQRMTEEGGVNKRKGALVFFRKYGGAVAAMLCVAIMIPAVIMLGRTGSQFSSTERMAETTAEEAAYEEAAAEEFPAEEAVCEMAEEASEEAPAAAMAENYIIEEKERAVGSVAGDLADRAVTESISDTEAEKEDKAGKVEKVAVSIQAELAETSEGQRFEVVVEEDASGQFAKGEKIVVLVPLSSSSMVIEEGEALEMDLLYDPEQDVFIMEKLY